jgi:hypothetical protein
MPTEYFGGDSVPQTGFYYRRTPKLTKTLQIMVWIERMTLGLLI